MTVRFIRAPGNVAVSRKIEGLGALFKQGMRQAMFKSGHSLIGRASAEILRKPKSGRTYIIVDRAGRRRRHVASAPGETHANITGKTRRALSFQLHGVSQLEFGYGVSQPKAGMTSDWAEFLEFGTSRMTARPSLQNALDHQQGVIAQHFQAQIDKQMR